MHSDTRALHCANTNKTMKNSGPTLLILFCTFPISSLIVHFLYFRILFHFHIYSPLFFLCFVSSLVMPRPVSCRQSLQALSTFQLRCRLSRAGISSNSSPAGNDSHLVPATSRKPQTKPSPSHWALSTRPSVLPILLLLPITVLAHQGSREIKVLNLQSKPVHTQPSLISILSYRKTLGLYLVYHSLRPG